MSSWLLQQSTAIAPDLGCGVSPVSRSSTVQPPLATPAGKRVKAVFSSLQYVLKCRVMFPGHVLLVK